MHFVNVIGQDLYIYPGFALLRSKASGQTTLIAIADLSIELVSANCVESETVPSDAEIVGTTWRKANIDGSRDMRFRDNYQLPRVRYAELKLTSPAGLLQVFVASNYERVRDSLRRALNRRSWTLVDLRGRRALFLNRRPGC